MPNAGACGCWSARSRSEVPKPIYTGEALEKHLQEYQMEILRGGTMPPLPVQLSAVKRRQAGRGRRAAPSTRRATKCCRPTRKTGNIYDE
jgi:hypothetical protein